MRRNDELQTENQSLRLENARLQRASEEPQWVKGGPAVVSMGNGSVLIGSSVDTHILTEDEYMESYLKASDPKDFVLRLLGKVFTDEELARSNFNGGQVTSGGEKVVKDRLCTKIAFKAVLAH